ncbi:non-ribosomal peptide synthetase [Nonomuraea angiospora]|uniref:non-ribosomal peptide synthetase n=1 Tax=Nonomuraea angiospora TaxID=46172 RepID=UPI00344B3AB8
MRRLEEAVRADPHRVAVSAADGALTFAELWDRINGLAGRLATRAMGPGSRIGVHVSRSVHLVPTLLAVWRVGAAFVPLDPVLPAGRLAAITRQSRVDALITMGERPDWATGVPALHPSDGIEPPRTERRPGNDDTAYVIYTSGSTGYPKGVEVTFGGVGLLLAALEESGVYPETPAVVACNASIGFDASVQQWLRVCRGDTVHIVDEEARTDSRRFATTLRQHAVTDLDATPSHWAALRDAVLTGAPLRVYLGGEAIPPDMWADLSALVRDGRLIRAVNLYGPTECTVDVTVAEVGGDGPHIGRPLAGRRIHVLDDRLRPVGIGVEGELYIGGPGLARGYFGDPRQSAARFVAAPFADDGARMYRTGDLARWRPDGTIDFLGRADRQIKVRGHRLEPGEIEAVMCELPEVARALVTLSHHSLVAYYVPTSDHRRDAEACVPRLRAHLSARLPSAMMPVAFVPLDDFPRTPSGKLDTAALPPPPPRSPSADVRRPAPVGEVETLVAGVWSEVLGISDISADDDFFALGGHSLVALHVVSRLRKQLGTTVSSKDVYRMPVLTDFARHIEELRTRQTSRPEPVP